MIEREHTKPQGEEIMTSQRTYEEVIADPEFQALTTLESQDEYIRKYIPLSGYRNGTEASFGLVVDNNDGLEVHNKRALNLIGRLRIRRERFTEKRRNYLRSLTGK